MRYLRQIGLPGFGEECQEKLAQATVTAVGCGGLGSPALLYLVAAGVGTVRFLDHDDVELTNLHRQVLHSTEAIGTPKVESAYQRLSALNPEVQLEPLREKLTPDNHVELLRGSTVVLDGSDNLPTRHLVSSACAQLGIPHIWASILGYEAQLSVFDAAAGGPIYEDAFPEPPAPGSVPSCAEAGVLGPVVGQVGCAMAMEAIKLITGLGEPLRGTIAYYDSLSARWEYIPLKPNPQVLERVRSGVLPEFEKDVPTLNRIPEGALIIDVRTPEECARGMIPGAQNIPLDEILAGATLPIHNPTLLYCQTGKRSERALRALLGRHPAKLFHLRGGYESWSLSRDPQAGA